MTTSPTSLRGADLLCLFLRRQPDVRQELPRRDDGPLAPGELLGQVGQLLDPVQTGCAQHAQEAGDVLELGLATEEEPQLLNPICPPSTGLGGTGAVCGPKSSLRAKDMLALLDGRANRLPAGEGRPPQVEVKFREVGKDVGGRSVVEVDGFADMYTAAESICAYCTRLQVTRSLLWNGIATTCWPGMSMEEWIIENEMRRDAYRSREWPKQLMAFSPRSTPSRSSPCPPPRPAARLALGGRDRGGAGHPAGRDAGALREQGVPHPVLRLRPPRSRPVG